MPNGTERQTTLRSRGLWPELAINAPNSAHPGSRRYDGGIAIVAGTLVTVSRPTHEANIRRPGGNLL